MNSCLFTWEFQHGFLCLNYFVNNASLISFNQFSSLNYSTWSRKLLRSGSNVSIFFQTVLLLSVTRRHLRHSSNRCITDCFKWGTFSKLRPNYDLSLISHNLKPRKMSQQLPLISKSMRYAIYWEWIVEPVLTRFDKELSIELTSFFRVQICFFFFFRWCGYKHTPGCSLKIILFCVSLLRHKVSRSWVILVSVYCLYNILFSSSLLSASHQQWLKQIVIFLAISDHRITIQWGAVFLWYILEVFMVNAHSPCSARKFHFLSFNYFLHFLFCKANFRFSNVI